MNRKPWEVWEGTAKAGGAMAPDVGVHEEARDGFAARVRGTANEPASGANASGTHDTQRVELADPAPPRRAMPRTRSGLALSEGTSDG